MNQVIDCIDDRKSCPYVRLKQIFHTTLTGYLLQFAIVLVFGGSSNLIGSHYRHIVQQQIFIKRGYIRTGSTIHKYRIENIHTDNLITKRLKRTFGTFRFQLFPVISQVKTLTAEHGFRSVGNTYHMEFQTVFYFQLFLLTADLLYQATSYRTNTTDKEIQHLIFGQEE